MVRFTPQTFSFCVQLRLANQMQCTDSTLHCIRIAGMYDQNIQQSMNQPGNVASPARGRLNRENEFSPASGRA